MEEVLTPVEKSLCKNCEGPITRYRGDLGSNSWKHDEAPSGTLWEPCPGYAVAEPIDVVEKVDDVQQHYRSMNRPTRGRT